MALNYLAALNSGHKLQRAYPLQCNQLRSRTFVRYVQLTRANARVCGMRVRCALNGWLSRHMA